MMHPALFAPLMAALLAGCHQSSSHVADKDAANRAADAAQNAADAATRGAAQSTADNAAETAKLCKSSSDLARSIMSSRQDGVPMSRAMELAADPDPAFAAELRKIVMEAYDSPHYGSEDVKRQEIADFADRAYLACEKDLSDT